MFIDGLGLEDCLISIYLKFFPMRVLILIICFLH